MIVILFLVIFTVENNLVYLRPILFGVYDFDSFLVASLECCE